MTAQCRSCEAPIVWVQTQNGKNMPVDAHTYDNGDGLIFNSEKHTSHFATCPNADKHRKKR